MAGPALTGSLTGIVVTMCWAGMVAGPLAFGKIVDGAGYFWGWLTVALCSGLSACLFIVLKSKTTTPQVTGI